MSNLTSGYTSEGDLTKAEEELLEILRIREDTLTYGDPNTVRYMVDLAGIYFEQKRWKDAALLLEPILSIRRRTMGDSHSMTMSIARQLESAYSELKGQTDNLTIQLHILNTAKKMYGEDHEQTLDALLSLIPTYVQKKMWKEAMETTEQVLEKQKRRLPADDKMIVDLSLHLDTLMREFPNQVPKDLDVSNIIYGTSGLDSRQIRIASIRKGSHSDPLEASLIPTLLDAPLPYEALSYVWGKDQSVGKMTLNGQCIDITPNLQGALMQLRSSTEDRLIWIDAICINQDDLKEQGKQVQLMREIYSNASRVILWLGEEAEDTKAAVEFLKALEIHPSPKEHAANILRSSSNDLIVAIVGGITELRASRPYWNRLWIIQEVMCAKVFVVHCGSLSFGYEILAKVYRIMGEGIRILVEEGYPNSTELAPILRLLIRGGGKPAWREPTSKDMPLEKHLVTNWTSECTDPKDRIYALLGISSLRNSTHPGLKVDYSQSTNEIYTGATRAIIEETGRLDVLSLAAESGTHEVTKPYKTRQLLPSWVPDWNFCRMAGSFFINIQPHSNASGNAKAEFGFSDDGTRLNVTGLGISSLEFCVQRVETPQMGLDDIIKLFQVWRKSTLKYCRPRHGCGVHSWRRKFYAMLGTVMPGRHNRPITTAEWSRWESALPMLDPNDSTLSVADETFLNFTYGYCVGRKLFYFKDSGPSSVGGFNIGLCPNAATEGDLLCVIPGCSIPLILHPVDEHFLVVGEAYVPDYDMGEAMEGNPELQIFTLH